MLISDINLAVRDHKPYLYRTKKCKMQGSDSLYEKQYCEQPNSCYVAKEVIPHNSNLYSVKFYKNVDIGEIHNIPGSVKHGLKYRLSNWYLRNVSAIYKVEDNKGIKYNDPRVRDVDICLAKYALKVAQDMDVSSACYTGVKHALWASGVLDDYSDMPKGSAHSAQDYFDAHPDKFKRLDVQLKDLKNLQAGCIIVYKKEGLDGHIAITNGNGQEMSDCTDNMKWVERRKNGATFTVYTLSDGWKYNPKTKKLEFNKNVS